MTLPFPSLSPKPTNAKEWKWITNCQDFHNLPIGQTLSTALQVIDPFNSTYHNQTSWRPSKKISANAIFAGLFKKTKNWSRLWQPNRSHPHHTWHLPVVACPLSPSMRLHHLRFQTNEESTIRPIKMGWVPNVYLKKTRGENESKSNLQLSEYIHPRKLLEGVFPFQRVDVWGAFRFSGVYTSQVSMQQNSLSWDKDQEPSTPPVRHQNCPRCTDVIVRLLRQAIQLLLKDQIYIYIYILILQLSNYKRGGGTWQTRRSRGLPVPPLDDTSAAALARLDGPQEGQRRPTSSSWILFLPRHRHRRQHCFLYHLRDPSKLLLEDNGIQNSFLVTIVSGLSPAKKNFTELQIPQNHLGI